MTQGQRPHQQVCGRGRDPVQRAGVSNQHRKLVLKQVPSYSDHPAPDSKSAFSSLYNKHFSIFFIKIRERTSNVTTRVELLPQTPLDRSNATVVKGDSGREHTSCSCLPTKRSRTQFGLQAAINITLPLYHFHNYFRRFKFPPFL